MAIDDPDPANPLRWCGEVTVSWSDIEQVPGGLVDVYYKIGLIGGNNRQKSIATPVDVTDAVPIKLASPEFPTGSRFTRWCRTDSELQFLYW